MLIVVLVLFLMISVFLYIHVVVELKKYNRKKLKSKLSGFEVSRKIIDNYDLNNIYITETRNDLISNYDSNRKVIRLTDKVFNEDDYSSCAISSLEAAHAIMDKKKDKMLIVKNKTLPVANILLVLGYLITIIGCCFGHINTIITGLCLIDFILLFHIVFYKIEVTARKIAIIELINEKIISKNEEKNIEKLLNVCSFKGIISVVFPVIELIKKIIQFGDSNR